VEAMKSVNPIPDIEDASNIKWISSSDALAALIWRSTAWASGVTKHKPFSFHVAANSRTKFNSPLPNNYFGNAYFRINPVDTVQNLNEQSLGYSVKIICKRLAEMNG
jgi:hypothetical protein